MSLELRGDRQLQQLLARLPMALNKKVINRVSRRGGRLVVNEARKNTNVVKGDLKRSIGIGSLKSRVISGVWVGARMKGQNKGKHAYLYAFGHKGRGANKGKGEWIKEAFGRVERRVENIMVGEFTDITENVIRKHKFR
jgi:hypothetical protein